LAPTGPFAFVQFEFGYALGPEDGRYLARDPGGNKPRAVLVLGTLGAPRSHRVKGRKPKKVRAAEPEPVPTTRATVVRPDPFASADEASKWMSSLKDDEVRDSEVAEAVAELNRLVRAHRAANADPWIRDVSPSTALVTRIGLGMGDDLANGRYTEALELPRRAARKRRVERLSPQERTAAVVGGRADSLACEELVLRARADLASRHWREAALQARIALECMVSEMQGETARFASEVEGARDGVSEAAGAALDGEISLSQQDGVARAVEAMEAGLRRYRFLIQQMESSD
jgi:hypothetical protein